MTTDELIAILKQNGVSGEETEIFRSLRPQSIRTGAPFTWTVSVPGSKPLVVHARFTGADQGFHPEWDDVTRDGLTVVPVLLTIGGATVALVLHSQLDEGPE
jgi:hypothetical protein